MRCYENIGSTGVREVDRHCAPAVQEMAGHATRIMIIEIVILHPVKYKNGLEW